MLSSSADTVTPVTLPGQGERHSSDGAPHEKHAGNAEGWYSDDPVPTLEQDVELARSRFVGWLVWYMRSYPEEAPTKEALARKLGITRSAVSQLLAPGATRAPDFKTLIAASRVLRFGVETLLGRDPPPVPPAREH